MHTYHSFLTFRVTDEDSVPEIAQYGPYYIPLNVFTASNGSRFYILFIRVQSRTLFLIFFFQRQHELNGGKCGVCGDAYDAVVRENEAGGKFANGIIANTYTTNDTSVPVVIDIQSFLKGYFEFRICPHNNIEVPVEQSCLDRHPLRVWDFDDSHPRYQYFPKGMGLQRLRVELPQGMTCSQCVLQWKWQTGIVYAFIYLMIID